MKKFGLLLNPKTGDYLLDKLLATQFRPSFIVTPDPHFGVKPWKRRLRENRNGNHYRKHFSTHYKAIDAGIQVFPAQALRGKQSRPQEWMKIDVDFIYVFTFRVIPGSALQFINIPIINFHSAFLPHHKGINPFFYVALNGDEFTGYSIHELTPKVDEGKIYLQERIPLNGSEDAELIRHMTLAQGARKSLQFIFECLQKIDIPKIDNPEGEYERRPTEDDAVLHSGLTSTEVIRRVQAASIWGGAPYKKDDSFNRVIHAFKASQTITENTQAESLKCSDGETVVLLKGQQNNVISG